MMYEIHGWLMSLAWGVLAPAAIVLAYNFRNVPPTNMWFHAHRAIMVRLHLTSPCSSVLATPLFWATFLSAAAALACPANSSA